MLVVDTYQATKTSFPHNKCFTKEGTPLQENNITAMLKINTQEQKLDHIC